MFRLQFILFQRRYFSSHIYLKTSYAILLQHGFTEKQAEKVLSSLDPFLHNKTHEIIHRSLTCWKENVWPKNSNDYLETQSNFIEVFSDKEARMLLMEEGSILNRVENLKNLDLVRGVNDIWKVFHKAPNGYFLQDWREFLKKYYYITYRILPWLIQEIETNSIHPLVQHPQVIEQTYNMIKTRFIFVQRTGFNVSENKKINLKTLLLWPVKHFISIYAPYCTIEEFEALEKLNSLDMDDDDKLFEDLVELSPKQSFQLISGKNKTFIEKNIGENILLSSLK